MSEKKLEEMDLDELDALLRGDPEKAEAVGNAALAPPVAEEPPKKEEPPVAEEPPPKKEEKEPPPPAEPIKEPEPEGKVKEEEPSALDLKLEEMALKLEQADLRTEKILAELERQKLLASREAGRAGHLKQQLELARSAAPAAEEPEEEEEPAPEKPRGRERSDPRLESVLAEMDEMRSEAALRVFEDEAETFMRRRPDAQTPEKPDPAAPSIAERMQPLLKQYEEDFRTELFGRDLKLARLTARSVFEAAYVDAKLAILEERKAAFSARSAEQFKRQSEAKAKASISGSAATASPKAKAKSLEEMSVEELETELRTMTR